MSNPQIILHWYPSSPFSQKVAWALQYKKIDFKVVLISPVEPRPLRRPLDAGYRKAPVLQIGNHTYCDSKVIFDEIEKRFPEPSLYPEGTKTSAIALGRWTDNQLFNAVVTQIPFKMLGDAFIKDRSSFVGKKIDPDLAAFASPFLLQSAQAELALVDKFVKEKSQDGALFALGTKTLSLADLHISMNLWFLRGFIGEDWLEENFPSLLKLLEKTLETVRFDDLDDVEQISEEDALKYAKEQAWELTEKKSDGSLNVSLGKLVFVVPTDTGMVPSIGNLVHSTVHETVIEHVEEEYGFTAYTHFPVLGFLVLPQDSKL